MDEGPDKFGDVSEEAAPPAEEFISESTFSSEMKEVKGAIISVTDEEKMTSSAPVITSIKSSAEVTRETKVVRSTALELPGPISGIVEESAPETIAGLFAAKKMLDLLIPNKRVEQLWSRADQLQTQVFCEINDLNLARALLEQIRSAKNLILADKENFEEAERSINEVEYRIIYGKRFKKWGLLGYILLAYEVICGAAAVYIMFLLFQAGTDGLNLSSEGLLTKNEIFIGIFAALFGALGGVAGALFALWRYITEQKFNPQFSIWYVTQPIIGLTIGSMIYIILKIGLSITAGSVNVEVGSLFLPCLLAYLAGFQQNVFLDLARQILKQLKIDKDKPEDKNLADSTNPAE